MNEPIRPVNAARMERVQGAANLPLNPEKLAALRAKLELPQVQEQTAGQLGTDQVIISELGKALCRFAQTLERNPEILSAFTARLPDALQAAFQNPAANQPFHYDAALQLCMALYGPEITARAATYGRNRKRQLDHFDYYRALMEHFGLQYDGDAPDAEEDRQSLWERFMHRLHAVLTETARPEVVQADEPASSEAPAEMAEQSVQKQVREPDNTPHPEGPPRLWP